MPTQCELQAERFYSHLRWKAGAKRRTTNNGQRRRANDEWAARQDAYDADLTAIVAEEAEAVRALLATMDEG